MDTLILGKTGSGKTTRAIQLAWEFADRGERVVFASSELSYSSFRRLVEFAVDGFSDHGINLNVLADQFVFVQVNHKLTDSDIANINGAFDHCMVDVIVLDGVIDQFSAMDFEDAIELFQTIQVDKILHADDVEELKDVYKVDHVVICDGV